MQIVIDIPDDVYEFSKRSGYVAEEDSNEVGEAIRKGTPLPKGHGRLIDADVVIKNAEKWGKDNPNEYIQHRNADIVAIMQDETAIIEADTESEE